MAEGGECGYYDPDLDNQIDNDDDDVDEQEVDRTQPFRPGAASTPYQGGEQYEMQTMMHEQSGLPSYGETTPLITNEEIERRLGALRKNPVTGLLDTTKIPDARVNPLSQEDKEEQIRRVKRLIKARYPNANVDGLLIKYSAKKPMDIVVLGLRQGETKIVLDDGSDLHKSFIDKAFVKNQLGQPARDVIQKTSSDIWKKQKELKDLRTSEQFLRSKDEEIRTLNERLNREQAKIDQLKEGQGPDKEAEIKRKEQMLKNLEKDLKSKKKKRSRRTSKKK